MGYDRRAQAGPLWLTYEDVDLGGFEVQLRRPGVDALTAITELDNFDPVEAVNVAELARCRPLVHYFADVLLGWNLEEGGAAVPCSAAAYLALDALFQLKTAKTWARVLAGLPQIPAVPAEPSIESTLPMETLAS